VYSSQKVIGEIQQGSCSTDVIYFCLLQSFHTRDGKFTCRVSENFYSYLHGHCIGVGYISVC